MILELLTKDGFSPKRKSAAEYASPCPACGGDDRFIIFTDSDRYWCRQCNASGDLIQYLRDFHNMGFKEAAEAVGKPITQAAVMNTKTATASRKIGDGNQSKTERPERWRKRMGDLSHRAHKQLLDNSSALEWLRNERGITVETADKFKLGWIDRDCYFKRQEAGLADNGKKLFIPSGLLIPWQDVRIRIRRVNPGDFGRYHVVPGSKSDPFIIGNFHQNTAVILESELDTILLAQESSRPLFIVALGSAQNKPDEGLLEMLKLCPVVLVALDNDNAGAAAARWWLENLNNTFRALSPKTVGKDLSDAYKNGLDLNEWLSVSVELASDRICYQR